MKIIIAQTGIESLMHGVSYFSLPLKRGRRVTAHYTDGSIESAEVSKETADAMRAYYRYAQENGPACECPSGFRIVGEIQARRITKEDVTHAIETLSPVIK